MEVYLKAFNRTGMFPRNFASCKRPHKKDTVVKFLFSKLWLTYPALAPEQLYAVQHSCLLLLGISPALNGNEFHIQHKAVDCVYRKYSTPNQSILHCHILAPSICSRKLTNKILSLWGRFFHKGNDCCSWRPST